MSYIGADRIGDIYIGRYFNGVICVYLLSEKSGSITRTKFLEQGGVRNKLKAEFVHEYGNIE